MKNTLKNANTLTELIIWNNVVYKLVLALPRTENVIVINARVGFSDKLKENL